VVAQFFFSAAGPAVLDQKVASLDPSQLPQAVFERGHARLCFWVAGDKTHQHAEAPHPFGLRERRKRPSDRAAEKRDEFAPSYAEHGDFLPKGQSSLSQGRRQVPGCTL
jgi:hypothetical protein